MILTPPPPYRRRRDRRRRRKPAAGPTPPPVVPAAVVSTEHGDPGGYGFVLLVFDRPIELPEPSPTPDDAVTFGPEAQIALTVSKSGTSALYFELETPVEPGQRWAIHRQPDWVTTVPAVPQEGDL